MLHVPYFNMNPFWFSSLNWREQQKNIQPWFCGSKTSTGEEVLYMNEQRIHKLFPQINQFYNPSLPVQCCQQNISLCNLKDYKRTALCFIVVFHVTWVHASGSNHFLKKIGVWLVLNALLLQWRSTRKWLNMARHAAIQVSDVFAWHKW